MLQYAMHTVSNASLFFATKQRRAVPRVWFLYIYTLRLSSSLAMYDDNSPAAVTEARHHAKD